MFTKIAIVLAIIAGPASGALAAPKQSGSAPYWTFVLACNHQLGGGR